jgi:hypothetical protein
LSSTMKALNANGDAPVRAVRGRRAVDGAGAHSAHSAQLARIQG